MYQGERPVLIMDDPFVNLDDRNMVGAVRLMSLLEEKYQITFGLAEMESCLIVGRLIDTVESKVRKKGGA